LQLHHPLNFILLHIIYTFNISKKTFIDGYEIHDIQNQCYETLFKCVSFYNLEKHRFVAYASNSIRNNINDLI